MVAIFLQVQHVKKTIINAWQKCSLFSWYLVLYRQINPCPMWIESHNIGLLAITIESEYRANLVSTKLTENQSIYPMFDTLQGTTKQHCKKRHLK